jgi:cytochrome P450
MRRRTNLPSPACPRGRTCRIRPERFLAADPPGTYEWIPFGGGVRRCLGASFALFEMKAVLRAVLTHPVHLEPRANRARFWAIR